MSLVRLRWILMGTICMIVALSIAGPSSRAQAAGNLLANASFEEGSYVYNNDGDQRVPVGWQPWWNTGKSGCENNKPHYEVEQHPTHVLEGSASARYYTAYSKHDGGLLQQISVTKGQRYRFTISGFAWSTDNPVVDSASNSSSHMMVGIDPSGGTNPYAGSVIWSGQRSETDVFVGMSVEAVATGTAVTVFTRTQPDWCVNRNDSFWDGASLTQTSGAPAATTPPPAATTPPPVATTPPPGVAPSGAVTATANITLNIRSGPTINNEIVGYLLKGKTATVVGRDSGTNWIYIDYNGLRGWVAGWLCTISGDIKSVPVVGTSGAPAGPGTGGSGGSPPSGSVIAKPRITVNMRSGPGVTYAPVGFVPVGQAVPVLGKDSTGSWLYVERNSVRGWIAGWLCDVTGDLNTVPVVTASGGPVGGTPPTPVPGGSSSPTGVSAVGTLPLNIRSGPGVTYQIIGVLQTGISVPVIGKSSNSGWIQIEYNGTKGWIAGWLCTIQGSLDSVPVTGRTPAALKVNYRPAHATGVTAVANVNITIRDYPSLSANKVGTLPVGVKVDVIGRTADTNWFFVSHNGVDGWIARWLTHYQGYLADVPVVNPDTPPTAPPPTDLPPASPTPSAPPGSVTATAKSGANIRSGPGTKYGAVGTLPKGISVPVIGKTSSNDWLFIDYKGTTGWVAAWLCTVVGDLSTVPVTAQSSGNAPPPSGGAFDLGGQVPGFIANPFLMREAHMTWAKSQVVWAPGMSPAETTGVISNAHAQGFKILLSIKGPLYPTSIDYAGYISFVGGVAQLGADGIEIWNEMNLDREWPAGQISPSDYVNKMLRPAYQQIKAVSPNTLVITGAPAPTGAHNGVTVWADDIYIAGMRDAGAASYADCIGVHYNAGATSPDATTGHPADDGRNHYSWYYQPTFNLYSGAFPGKNLCYTEIGYVSADGYPPLPPNFWWGYGTSVGEQGEWLGRAVTLAKSSGNVRLMIIFNVDFTVYGEDPQAGYAILRPDLKCPACSKLAAAVP